MFPRLRLRPSPGGLRGGRAPVYSHNPAYLRCCMPHFLHTRSPAFFCFQMCLCSPKPPRPLVPNVSPRRRASRTRRIARLFVLIVIVFTSGVVKGHHACRSPMNKHHSSRHRRTPQGVTSSPPLRQLSPTQAKTASPLALSDTEYRRVSLALGGIPRPSIFLQVSDKLA